MHPKHQALTKLGTNIRAARRALPLSQEGLGLKAGLDRSYVGSVERGERNITILNLLRLARALHVQPSLLIQNLESPSRRSGSKSRRHTLPRNSPHATRRDT